MLNVSPLFGLLGFPLIYLAIPLAVAFSLAYAATREESPILILKRAGKVAFWLFFFMALVAAILYVSV